MLKRKFQGFLKFLRKWNDVFKVTTNLEMQYKSKEKQNTHKYIFGGDRVKQKKKIIAEISWKFEKKS